MDDQYSFRALNSADRPEIIRTFNDAFSDYLIQVRLSSADLDFKCRSESLDWSSSAGCWHQDRLCGFVFTGLDPEGLRAYNGGTGVVPEARGRSVTCRMYEEFLFPLFREAGIRETVLEVITNNDPALRIYRKLGMTTTRELICFQQRHAFRPAPSPMPARTLSFSEWRAFDPTRWWEWQPTWQHDLRALEQSWPWVQILGVFDGSDLIAYAAFHPQRGRVLQFAVKPGRQGQGLGKQLFAAMGETCGLPLSMINIDASSSSSVAFLRALGMRETLRQYEMVMAL